MSNTIKVEDISIPGKFSVVGAVDRTKNPPVLSVTGVIETSTRLPDSFSKLEGGRAVVYDILIDSESLGSEDNNIVYGFSAKRYDILTVRKQQDEVISDV